MPLGNHKMPTLTQDYKVYLVYHYATTTGPLLNLWFLDLGGGCVLSRIICELVF